MASEHSYCLFISKPTGYELLNREGDPPPVGSVVEIEGQGRWEVNRIRRLAAAAGPPALRVPAADA